MNESATDDAALQACLQVSSCRDGLTGIDGAIAAEHTAQEAAKKAALTRQRRRQEDRLQDE